MEKQMYIFEGLDHGMSITPLVVTTYDWLKAKERCLRWLKHAKYMGKTVRVRCMHQEKNAKNEIINTHETTVLSVNRRKDNITLTVK
jgi:hypothetical protein